MTDRKVTNEQRPRVPHPPVAQDAPASTGPAPTLRQRAIAAIAEGAAQPESHEALWPKAAQQALHELRVHQVELELQNEELRRSQLALDAARARYFELYNLAPAGYVTIGKPGLILEANLVVGTLLGIARNRLVGQPISRFILREDQDLFYLKRKHAFESGEPRAFELRMVKHDGTPVWVHLATAVAHDAEGAAELRITLSDITKLKLDQQNLEQLLAEKEALLENEQASHQQIHRLSLALEQIAESVVITNLTGGIEYVNEAFARHSGYSRKELIGRNPRILESGKTPRETYVALWAALRRGQTWQGEFCNRRKDGSEYTESAVISPVRQVNGQITHYVGAKTDITLRKRSEEELRQAKEAAEAANVAKSRFLASMSHEIRTPMNGILGMAQLLQMPNISEAERQDYARTILGSGQELLALLNDILDLSKIEAGKVELESVALEPGRVIGETQGLFAEIARDKGLRIETDCSGAARHYLGDAHRLRQMLTNLVSNAVKFTARGCVRIEAREVVRDAGAVVLEFSVTDTGIGIVREEQSLLFQPFSQGDASITRNYGGTGLGLSIVRTLARLMGGEAGFESEAGHGSRFWFRIRAGLVAADEHSREAAPPPGAAPSTGAAPAKFSGRVLVVEDNPVNQKVIELLLQKFGLSTALAGDGQQAIDALMRGEEADLILMDVHMPRMDGHAATARIRDWERNTGRRHPIVALTADAFWEDRRRCLAAGMDDVMTKPIVLGVLKEVLGKWLPAAAGAVAAPPAQDKPVDVARVATLVEEILPLLAQNKFSAVGRFRALQEVLAGTHAAAEIDETGRLLEDMRFDLASERLHRMAKACGWEKTA